MKSKSEKSYGARSANAAKVRDAISSFTNYAPPLETETKEAYNSLIMQANESNLSVSIAIDNYNSAVRNRSNAFIKDTISVKKLLSPISKAVIARFGKDSREATQIKGMIADLRKTKLIKVTNANGDVHTISQSEQSFGTLTQAFKNIVATISNFVNYNPSRAELKLPALQSFAASLDELNQKANSSLLVLREKRGERNSLYDDLSVRTQRIKAYVASEFGNSSLEYKAIKGLNV